MAGKVKGFSLIEVLVVIIIIAILMGIAFGPLRNQILKSKVNQAVNSLVADLNEMKRRSITENASYGVVMGVTSYITFIDTNGDCNLDSGEDITRVNLPSGVSMSTSNTTSLVVWTRKGVPLNSTCGFYSGTIILNAGNYQKRVSISRYGRITVD